MLCYENDSERPFSAVGQSNEEINAHQHVVVQKKERPLSYGRCTRYD